MDLKESESCSSSPVSTTDFVYVEDNVSNCSKKSESSHKSSFTDLLSNQDDDMPKMEVTDNDVSKLVHEAQMDCFISDYYGDTEDGDAKIENKQSTNSSDEEQCNSPKTTLEGEIASDACISFHGVTYLGASKVDAPVSDLELKRSISILRDNKEATIDVILSVSLSPTGYIKLLDPVSRTEIASYNVNNICYWGKGDSETSEKDCLAFNISQGKENVTYLCHVFQCAEEDDVS